MVQNMKYFIVLMTIPTMMHGWWWLKAAPQAAKVAYEANPVAKKLTCYSFLSGTLPIQNKPIGQHSHAVFSQVGQTLIKDCSGAGGESIEQCMKSSLPLYDCIAERRQLLLDLAKEGQIKLADNEVAVDQFIYQRELNQDPIIQELAKKQGDKSSQGSYHRRLYQMTDGMIDMGIQGAVAAFRLAVHILD